MKLQASVDVPHPRDRVFAAYRDELPELVPYLPNVRAIETRSRTENGQVVELVNHWVGGGDLPAVARRFVSEDLLSWDDHARWDGAAFVCRWRTEVPRFRDALRAEGETRFEPTGPESTRVVIEGDIEVDASKVRAVPRIFAGSVGPAVASFLVATIRPNLVAVANAVGRLLTERALTG
jgi:hypothetical protein